MPSSDDPDVITFNESLPKDGLETFIRDMTKEDGRRDDILGLPNDPSAKEEVVRGIYEKSMELVLQQVRPNLKRILGSHWRFHVRNQYQLNAPTTELGTKYKDTDLYKEYVKLVDGPNVTSGLRMLYNMKKPPMPDLGAAETTTPAMAPPITPSVSPPADDLLPIDPDHISIDDHPRTEDPIETGDTHDTSHAVNTDDPIGDASEDMDVEVDVAVDSEVAHLEGLFSPVQSDVGTNTTPASVRKSREQGPNRFDITLLAAADKSEKKNSDNDHHVRPEQMVGGLVEIRYISEKEVEGTVLAIPREALDVKKDFSHQDGKSTTSRVDEHPSRSDCLNIHGDPDPTEVTGRPLSLSTQRVLQDLIAQTVWYLINVDAMSAVYRPVYGMAVLNGWFVRMVVDGADRVLYIETGTPTSNSTSTNTSENIGNDTKHETSAPKSSSLKSLLTWFQYGRLPHHLATNSGAEKLDHWTIAGFRSFVLPATSTTKGKEDTSPIRTASAAETRTDLKRGPADVSANEELVDTNRQKRTKTVREEDSFQARDPAGPSITYQSIREKDETETADEPGRKVITWLDKVDNSSKADQDTIAVDLDESFDDDDEGNDNHNSSDSQEYRDYLTIVGQMEFLDQLGWKVEYCSIARFDELLCGPAGQA